MTNSPRLYCKVEGDFSLKSYNTWPNPSSPKYGEVTSSKYPKSRIWVSHPHCFKIKMTHSSSSKHGEWRSYKKKKRSILVSSDLMTFSHSSSGSSTCEFCLSQLKCNYDENYTMFALCKQENHSTLGLNK